ncbi:MAG: acyl-CoA thioesterase [Pseudodonghicola sp.]
MELRYHIPLTAEEQLGHGLPHPFPLAIADRVRFSELDTQSHVNNKSYMEWFERARVEHLNRVFHPFYGDAPRPRVALHSATIRYVKEMLAGEDYIVTARVAAFRTNSYTLEQQIWSGDLRATLMVIAVLQRPGDPASRYPLPAALCDHLIRVEGAQREG